MKKITKFRWLLLVALAGSVAATVRADEVTDWNLIAVNNAAVSGTNPILQSRVFAMTHAAIHDALNAIDRRYKPYALDTIDNAQIRTGTTRRLAIQRGHHSW